MIHTEVDERFEGHGIGSRLISFALDDARGRALDVLPFCPFVDAYVKRHPEYVDLVPVEMRPNFGLSERSRPGPGAGPRKLLRACGARIGPNR